MRTLGVRFTVRRMMFAVAVVAIALVIGIEVDRIKRYRDHCIQVASVHGADEFVSRESALNSLDEADRADRAVKCLREFERQRVKRSRGPEPGRADGLFSKWRADLAALNEHRADDGRWHAARANEYATYYAGLKEKYLRAAARPWFSVEPDAPQPRFPARDCLPAPPGPDRFIFSEHGRVPNPGEIPDKESLKYRAESVREINDFAWFLSTNPDPALRNGPWAVRFAGLACELTFRPNADYLSTLAAALAESGHFEAAVQAQREAISLLTKGNRSELGFRERLKLYETKRPFRTESSSGK